MNSFVAELERLHSGEHIGELGGIIHFINAHTAGLVQVVIGLRQIQIQCLEVELVFNA